jgi:hypothetical protein
MHEDVKSVYKMLLRKLESNRPLGSPGRKRKDGNKYEYSACMMAETFV